MMPEQVRPDIFNLPCHKLNDTIQGELDALLKQYESQFMKDKTSIRTTPLTSMMIDMGNSDPVSQKPYPITTKHYQWVKEEIEKLLTAKVICSSRSSWSAPIIVVPKSDRGKCLVIDYRALNKVTRNSFGPCQSQRYIFQTEWSYIFYNVRCQSRLPSHTIRQTLYPENSFQFTFWKI